MAVLEINEETNQFKQMFMYFNSSLIKPLFYSRIAKKALLKVLNSSLIVIHMVITFTILNRIFTSNSKTYNLKPFYGKQHKQLLKLNLIKLSRTYILLIH